MTWRDAYEVAASVFLLWSVGFSVTLSALRDRKHAPWVALSWPYFATRAAWRSWREFWLDEIAPIRDEEDA